MSNKKKMMGFIFSFGLLAMSGFYSPFSDNSYQSQRRRGFISQFPSNIEFEDFVFFDETNKVFGNQAMKIQISIPSQLSSLTQGRIKIFNNNLNTNNTNQGENFDDDNANQDDGLLVNFSKIQNHQKPDRLAFSGIVKTNLGSIFRIYLAYDNSRTNKKIRLDKGNIDDPNFRVNFDEIDQFHPGIRAVLIKQSKAWALNQIQKSSRLGDTEKEAIKNLIKLAWYY